MNKQVLSVVTKEFENRITESFELEGTFKSQIPCTEQRYAQLYQELTTWSSLALHVSRDKASTTSLGNPFQCFTILTIKDFFLNTQLKSTLFKLEIISHCPIATDPAKESVPFFLTAAL